MADKLISRQTVHAFSILPRALCKVQPEKWRENYSFVSRASRRGQGVQGGKLGISQKSNHYNNKKIK